MEVSNGYLMGSWTVSNNITNSRSPVSRRARIYLKSVNGENELVDLSSSKVALKKPAHKSI
jgi:hypothetical protein